MHEDDENIEEDSFKISEDDPEIENLEGITDFGLDEEDPDRDH
jgi:hypothetical protein